MGNIRSTSKFMFMLMMLWTIICLSIFLFIVPNFAQAKTGSGGAITGHRAPFQTKSRDVVGKNEILRGDGINDWQTDGQAKELQGYEGTFVEYTNSTVSIFVDTDISVDDTI